MKTDLEIAVSKEGFDRLGLALLPHKPFSIFFRSCVFGVLQSQSLFVSKEGTDFSLVNRLEFGSFYLLQWWAWPVLLGYPILLAGKYRRLVSNWVICHSKRQHGFLHGHRYSLKEHWRPISLKALPMFPSEKQIGARWFHLGFHNLHNALTSHRVAKKMRADTIRFLVLQSFFVAFVGLTSATSIPINLALKIAIYLVFTIW